METGQWSLNLFFNDGSNHRDRWKPVFKKHLLLLIYLFSDFDIIPVPPLIWLIRIIICHYYLANQNLGNRWKEENKEGRTFIKFHYSCSKYGNQMWLGKWWHWTTWSHVRAVLAIGLIELSESLLISSSSYLQIH